MTFPVRLNWVHNVEPPPPTVCSRIATNQIGEAGVIAEPLPDFPGSGVWTGSGSNATGTHQRYEYVEDAGGEENVFQQFIVMSDVIGNFVQNEALNGVAS